MIDKANLQAFASSAQGGRTQLRLPAVRVVAERLPFVQSATVSARVSWLVSMRWSTTPVAGLDKCSSVTYIWCVRIGMTSMEAARQPNRFMLICRSK